MNKNIIIIGIVLFVVIVFMWSNALSDITVGRQFGSIFVGNTASQAAAQRANIS